MQFLIPIEEEDSDEFEVKLKEYLYSLSFGVTGKTLTANGSSGPPSNLFKIFLEIIIFKRERGAYRDFNPSKQTYELLLKLSLLTKF